MSLTPLALENAAVLRRIARPDAAALTFAALADDLGRDPSNLRKTLQKLESEGVVARRDGGCGWLAAPYALAALDRLDGLAGPGTAPLRWPLDHLAPDPTQPRKAFDPDALADLARSIAAAQDVLVPLLVLPPDASGARTIKAGERRWRAVRLLAEGAVEGCALPAVLDPRLGGGLPIREIEPEAGDAAWIALTENGNRVDLNPIEDGEALLALMAARGWSARETAHRLGRVGKRTGEAGAGSDGVKTVQERVKVAREASADDKARFLAGELTWKQLLETVQRPAAPLAAPGTAGASSGDWVRLEPTVVFDIAAMPGWAMNGLEARISLAPSPAGGWAYGYHYKDNETSALSWPSAPVDRHTGLETRADAFARAAAIIRGAAGGRAYSQRATALRVRALEWLAALGDGARDPAQIPPRKPTAREAEAERIARGEGGAATPRARPTGEQVASAALADRPAPTLSPAIAVALAEICDIHVERGDGPSPFLPWADTHQYWLDAELGDAIAAGFLRMEHGADHPPRAVVTDAGRTALLAAIRDRTGGELEDWPEDPRESGSVLLMVRRAFAPGAEQRAEPFVTPWLNPPPEGATAAAAPPPTPGAPPPDEDLEDDRTVDDILGPLALMNIVEAADPANGPAFLSGLFERVGFKGPFVASQVRDEEGLVHDATGRCLLVCDRHGEETHDMALAQAIVVAAALNAALGLAVDVAPRGEAA